MKETTGILYHESERRTYEHPITKNGKLQFYPHATLLLQHLFVIASMEKKVPLILIVPRMLNQIAMT